MSGPVDVAVDEHDAAVVRVQRPIAPLLGDTATVACQAKHHAAGAVAASGVELAVGVDGRVGVAVVAGLVRMTPEHPSAARVQADDVPTQAALLQGSLQFLQKLRHSLIEFETVTPAEYQLQSTNEP